MQGNVLPATGGRLAAGAFSASSRRGQVGEFGVATPGGIWVAIGVPVRAVADLQFTCAPNLKGNSESSCHIVKVGK
jgi:hypothetical protein